MREGNCPFLTILIVVIATTVIICFPILTEPWSWLPEPNEADTLLTGLLTAQAAIAALTLAVTLFVMQGVNARGDADDRMYREYVRQSWVRPIFRGSVLSVGVTGLVFLALEFLGGLESTKDIISGLGNLIVLAAGAFVANLVFSGILFEKALRLSQPQQWSTLRRHVNERDVRNSIQAYLSRRRRALDSLGAGQPDTSTLLPDPGEGSANEAITSLLDDARRALVNNRLQEFSLSMESIKGLLQHALTEIEKQGIAWGPPGSRPEWPPLRELGRNLYAFREDVIRDGNREYLTELLGLDYWLLSNGARERCGELFTAGLEGHRANYQISARVADAERKDILRDRAWLNSPWTITGGEPEEALPYAFELVRHQEGLLSDALNLDQLGDFEALHKGSETCLRLIRWNWDRQGHSTFSNMLEQFYRVVLMGLGGRAIILAESGKIENPSRYATVSPGAVGNIPRLAADVAEALGRRDRDQNSQWSEWDREGAEPFVVQTMSAEQYPLTFFAVRLMELTSETMPGIYLRGTAGQALNWFESNAERLLPYVEERPDATREQRREWAAASLRRAVKRDEIAEDERIIASELSPERIANFKSGVYGNAFAIDPIESLFEECGAFLYLSTDSNSDPKEMGFFPFEHKAFLAEPPSNERHHYVPLEGDEYGRTLANDAMTRLCAVLDESQEISAAMDTPAEFLGTLSHYIAELGSPSKVVAVLAGDWFDIEMALHTDSPEGFIPAWQLPEIGREKALGHYQGQTLIRGPRYGERRLYLDPEAWGCFVRAQCEDGEDLRIDISPVTADQAQKLLEANPDHFPDEPDIESKTRKLQTMVQLEVVHRIEFRVKDNTRARRIVAEQNHQDSD